MSLPACLGFSRFGAYKNGIKTSKSLQCTYKSQQEKESFNFQPNRINSNVFIYWLDSRNTHNNISIWENMKGGGSMID